MILRLNLNTYLNQKKGTILSGEWNIRYNLAMFRR